MILCKVTESVVSTIKHPRLDALTVFVVQPITPDGKDAGETFLAVDHAQAGPGDTVIVLREGNGIRQVLRDPQSPVRCVIAGVVDAIQTA